MNRSLNAQELSELAGLIRPAFAGRTISDEQLAKVIHEWLEDTSQPLLTRLQVAGLISGWEADTLRRDKPPTSEELKEVQDAPTLPQGERAEFTPQFILSGDPEVCDAHQHGNHVEIRTSHSRGSEQTLDSHARGTNARGSLEGPSQRDSEGLHSRSGNRPDLYGASGEEKPASIPHPTASGRDSIRNRSRFSVLRPLDRGGLGVLEVARDGELGREVALKRIRPDKANKPIYRAKFIREAEVTGNLEHPGVVPVYGMGIDERGQPYYAMRLIRGKTLAQQIRQFHSQRRADPQAYHSPEFHRLLDHFLTVCRTIAYAHSRGVLHRDLKPVNVMVGRYGETFVVDWGLAKFITEAELDEELPVSEEVRGSSEDHRTATRYGVALGTPAYAPPEQVRGQLDRIEPRSDVYGLGAILFELLTEQPPVIGETVTELIYRAGNGQVGSILELCPRVPPALAAICMKAIEKEPADRYPMVDALIEDLERWKADAPVSAFPENWLSRAYRWGRRHRTVTMTAAVGLLAVMCVSTIAAVLILKEKNHVQSLARQEYVARQTAERTRDFIVRAFRSPDPQIDGRSILVAEVLQRAGADIDAELKDQPELQAALNQAVGESLHGLGLPEQATERLRLAHSAARRVFGDHHPRTIESLHLLGVALGRQGDLVAAEQTLTDAVSAAEQLWGRSADQTLPILLDLAESQWRSGKFHESIRSYKQVHERCLQHPSGSSQLLWAALHGLAWAELSSGNVDAAEPRFAQAVEGRTRSLGATARLTLDSLAGLAECKLRSGRPDLAESLYRTVLAGRTDLLGEDHADRLATLSDLAGVLRKLQRNEEALDLYKEANARYTKKLGENHPETLAARSNLAEAYIARGSKKETLDELRQIVAVMRLELSDTHPARLTAEHNLAYALHGAGEFSEAESIYARVAKLREEQLGPDHEETLSSQLGLGETLSALERHEEALKLLRLVLKRQTSRLGPNHPDVAATEIRLADALCHGGDFPDSLAIYDRAINTLTQSVERGPDHPETLVARVARARAALYQLPQNLGTETELPKVVKDAAMWQRELESVVKKLEAVSGAEHLNTLLAKMAWGEAALLTGDLGTACPVFESLTTQMETRFGRTYPSRLRVLNLLGVTYQKMQLFEDAERVLSGTLALQMEDQKFLRGALMTTRNLARSRQLEGRLGDALEPAELAVKIAQQTLGPTHRQTRLARRELAHLLQALQRYEEALEQLNQARVPVTDTTATKEERWEVDQTLASTLVALQRDQQAIPLLQEILDQQVKLLGTNHPTVWESQLRLASTLRRRGSSTAALELLLDRQQHVDLAQVSLQSRWEGPHLIGAILLDQQRPSEAERWLAEAYAVAKEGMPGTWPWAWSGALLGRTFQLQGNREKSEELFDLSEASLRSLDATLPPELKGLSSELQNWRAENRPGSTP